MEIRVGNSLPGNYRGNFQKNSKPSACCTAPPAVLDGGGSTPGFCGDYELLVRASAVRKSQGQKTGPVGDPVRKRFGPLPLHHQNLFLSLFELQGQLANFKVESYGAVWVMMMQ